MRIFFHTEVSHLLLRTRVVHSTPSVFLAFFLHYRS